MKPEISVIAPQFMTEPWSESEVFGAMTWLWLHSKDHNTVPVFMLSAYILPVIQHRQFILAMENGKPVGYVSWALLNEETEALYLQSNQRLNDNLDWQSGDRMWFIDWFAPFGHSKLLKQLIERRFFLTGHARALYHRGEEKGGKILSFHGMSHLPEENEHWEATHPICYPK